MDIVITKYTGHLIVHNVLQNVVIYNLKLYGGMICT